MKEIKKIEVQGQQYGVADMLMRSVMGGNAQVIEWSHTHNMNDYKEAGTYRIKGERTGNPLSDNLPIMNSGSGHTIEGILYVLDSSLANGSGKESDCTITQFLMLSNRVGGQEGDMYMRSAYGTKDSLTWKPWEKYQTNMEVGCVSDGKLLNPNNPTEILKHDSGMNHITDNGIYSGIYFGPKCMVGTGDDDWHISFQDATAIETFVMVVINNYASAGDNKTITQIKFAVTNGGVFSMEKRSTDPGTLNWSQWEAVGGGSGVSFDIIQRRYVLSTDKTAIAALIGTGVNISAGVNIGTNVRINEESGIQLGSIVCMRPGYLTGGEANCVIGNCAINVEPSPDTPHTMNKTTIRKGSYLDAIIGTDIQLFGYFTEDRASKERTLIIGTGAIIGESVNYIPDDIDTYLGVVIGENVRIEDNIHIRYSESDDGILFSHNGRTALLRFG